LSAASLAIPLDPAEFLFCSLFSGPRRRRVSRNSQLPEQKRHLVGEFCIALRLR
jgi:hypothetical protein